SVACRRAGRSRFPAQAPPATRYGAGWRSARTGGSGCQPASVVSSIAETPLVSATDCRTICATPFSGQRRAPRPPPRDLPVTRPADAPESPDANAPAVRYERAGEAGRVVFDQPGKPVNALNAAAQADLEHALDAAEKDHPP